MKRIVERLKQEVCLEHKKSAKIKCVKDVIVISNYCCSGFYNHLSKKLQEEININSFRL